MFRYDGEIGAGPLKSIWSIQLEPLVPVRLKWESHAEAEEGSGSRAGRGWRQPESSTQGRQDGCVPPWENGAGRRGELRSPHRKTM